MWSQLFLIFIGIVGLTIFGRSTASGSQDQRRKIYIIFLSIFLILQSGLRNVAIGADTYEYSKRFAYYGYCSWRFLWEDFIQTLAGESKDAGYGLINKAIYTICPEYQIYLFAVAIFFFTVLGRFMYKYTSSIYQVFLILCFYQMFFYTFFSITGIRQTIAVGFTLWSYEYISKHKLLPFFILVLVAATIHKTALVFIPFYWLSQVKKGRTAMFCAFAALPILMVKARAFAIFLSNVAGDYAAYSESTYADAGGPNYLLMLLLLSIPAYMKYKHLSSRFENKLAPFINALAITLVLSPLVWVDPSLLRLSYYYSIFILGLFPHLVETLFPQKNFQFKFLVTGAIIIIICFLIIHTDSYYSFFWQPTPLGPNYR